MPKGIFNKEGLLSELKKKLPEYMIPARVGRNGSVFRLLPNGKLDRKALSKPDINTIIIQQICSTAQRSGGEVGNYLEGITGNK
ncbi:MAG: hypothetical protein WKF59_24155 [Chitinophagaceae bacterium]